MSTNGANIEDTEMGECEGEKVVTMMDVLQEQQEFEEDANAVLGASDDKNCTYSKGYIKRQAVYACLTCCNEAKHDPDKRAGVCLACSLTCHENHDLVELYTKRNFRCDCGNPKFNHPCQYTENKTALNDDNTYNQNFSGLYCTCHRPYPDPDGVEEEMIQCIVCEDWLHASHLEATLPSIELYAEMICKACMNKNEFLHDYSKYAVNGDVDVVDTSKIEESSVHCNGASNKMNGIGLKSDVDKTGSKEIGDSSQIQEVDLKSDVDKTESDEIGDSSQIHAVDLKSDVDKTESEEIGDSSQIHGVVLKTDVDKTESEEIGDSSQIHGVDLKTGVDKTESDEIRDSSKTNGVDLKTDVDKTEPEEISFPDEAKNEVSPTEAMNTSHDNIDEHKPDEQMQPNVSETADNENPLEENKAEQTNQTVSEKIGDENPIEDNFAEDIVTDKADSANPSEDSKAIDTNKEDTPTSNETSGNKVDDNLDSAVSARDQENFDETINKVDETSNKVNGTTDVTDVNIAEQSKQENPPEIPQESIGNDASGDQMVDDKTNQHLKVDSQEEQAVPQFSSNDSTLMSDADNNIETAQVANNHVEDETKDNKRKLSTEESTLDTSAKRPKLIESDCLRPRGQKKIFKGATFWPSHFRQKICTCNECITMYKDLSVLFLIDLEDTVSAYEVLGKEMTDGAASTQYEKGLEALSSLGRIQQINALTEYNKMKDKLLDFLKSFKDRKEVVKEEDIKTFFAGMKPKREPDGVYFCR